MALALGLSAASALPLPYAISGPGPTLNTLGKADGKPLIAISGAQTYPTTGELRLTTVSTAGGPGYPGLARRGDPRLGVRLDRRWCPSSRSSPPQQTKAQIDQQGQAEMTTSQEDASVAALEELGYTVPTTLTVGGVVDGSGAKGRAGQG